MVTSKCDEGPVRTGPSNSIYPHVSTSACTGLGLDELDTVLARLAFPEAVKQTKLWTRITNSIHQTFRSLSEEKKESSYRPITPNISFTKPQLQRSQTISHFKPAPFAFRRPVAKSYLRHSVK